MYNVSIDSPRFRQLAEASDAFHEALAKGFFLRAREPMIYLGYRTRFDDRHGWQAHRFASFTGRQIVIMLPAYTHLYANPLGRGAPASSLCTPDSPWGRIPRRGGRLLTMPEEMRLQRLWVRSQPQEPAAPAPVEPVVAMQLPCPEPSLLQAC